MLQKEYEFCIRLLLNIIMLYSNIAPNSHNDTRSSNPFPGAKLDLAINLIKVTANENLPTDLSSNSIARSTTSPSLDALSHLQPSQLAIIPSTLTEINPSNALSFLKNALATPADTHELKIYTQNLLNFITKNIRVIMKRDLDTLKGLDAGLLEEILTQSLESVVSSPYLNTKTILAVLLEVRGKNSLTELLLSEYSRNKHPYMYIPITEFTVSSMYSSEIDILGIEFRIECKNIDGVLSILLHSTGNFSSYSLGNIAVISTMLKIEQSDYNSIHYTTIPIAIGSTFSYNLFKTISNIRNGDCRVTLLSRLDHVSTSILISMAEEPSSSLLCENLLGLSEKEIECLMSSRLLNVRSEDEVAEIVARWAQHNQDTYQDGVDGLIERIKWEFVSVEGIVSICRSYSEIKNCELFVEMYKDVIARNAGIKLDPQDNPRSSYKQKLPISPSRSLKDVVKSLGNFLLSSDFTPNYKARFNIQMLSKQRELASKEETASHLRALLDSAYQSTGYQTSPLRLEEQSSSTSHKRIGVSLDLHSTKLVSSSADLSRQSSEEATTFQTSPLLRYRRQAYVSKITADISSRLSV
jgi:hypothetical protein